jgi:hypothetical protein
MARFLDVCRFVPTAGGTSDWTVSAAVGGYQTPTAAGAVNGASYRYRAESSDLTQWEVGYGTYTSGVLSRSTVLFNSAGTTAKIGFSTVPQVAIVALGEDLLAVDEANAFTPTQQDRARSNIGAAPGYPDFWNGSFSLWQRATVFTFNGGTQSPNYGQYTADCCSNGAGTGGVATVQKYTLNATEQAAITPSINPPSTGMRMTWTTAPTSGGGQSGYTAYASFVELKGNNVANYAGKTVTVSVWIRCATGQSLPFYLYVALGGLTATGHLGSNTIVGTAAGVDCTTAGDTEIFARSARMTTAVGPTWQRFSYTLTLDNLQAATLSTFPVVNIGIGMDYTDITSTTDIYITALNLDPGPAVLPWREWPDEAKWTLATYNFQRIGLGAVGYCVSTTTIQVSLNMKGIIKANGAGGGGLFTLPGVNPTISCSNSASFTGSSSAFSVISASAYGMFLNITGFSGLAAGASCVMTNDWLYSAQG